MTNYMRGARPKGSPKPTKGLYKKRGANKNKTPNVRIMISKSSKKFLFLA